MRAAIARIAGDTERAFDERALWPAHPVDEAEGPLPHVTSLYLGAAGVIWSLHMLERAGAVELRRAWADVASGLPDRYRSAPDFPELVDGPVPSLWSGEAGILLVAHTLAPAAWQEERLLEAVLANVESPSRELMWGSPGTMLAAQVMLERTGAQRWLDAWNASAERLWADWRDEVWHQELYGTRAAYLGPAHGFAGNVFVLARGEQLDRERRAELERRTLDVLTRHANLADGLAQWPPRLGARPDELRTQWCHGAPGMVAMLCRLAPHHDELTSLLVAGGELTWQAGPLRKGAGLCHGTAGYGYALLRLFERTGDELWLARARAFAMHAIEQVEQARTRYGRGRYTLWTGDPGTAVYLASCLEASAPFPTLDHF